MERPSLQDLPLPSSFKNYPNHPGDNTHNSSSSDNVTDEEGRLADLEDDDEEEEGEGESESDHAKQHLNSHHVSNNGLVNADDDYQNVNRDRANSTSTATQANVMNRSRPKKNSERRSSFYRAPVLNESELEAIRSPSALLPHPIITDFRQSDSPYTRETRGSRFEEDINGPSYSYNQYQGNPSPVDAGPSSAISKGKVRDRSSFYGLDSTNQSQDRSAVIQRPDSASNSYSSHDPPTRYQSQQSSLQPAYSYPTDGTSSPSQNQSRQYPPQAQTNNDRSTNTRGSAEFPSFVAPATLLDQSHLHPGNLASLLSHEKTLDLYRTNAKKTGDPDVQFEFCTFVMDVVGELEAVERQDSAEGPGPATTAPNVTSAKTQALIAESVALLSKLATRGHVKSQYFLADCYTQGVGTQKGKRDFDKAYPLFVLAGKHGHADACFRAAQCCENGWGCRKDFSKAVTYLRKSAMLGHPPAMHRLGLAEMNGELSLTKRPKEGLKWIRRAAELADQVDPPQPQSLHELAMLNEKGIENVVFVDHEYSAELYARAAELGYSPSAYKLGECYEYGKMGCPQDSALSIHYYNIAAQQNHREACFALTAWYLVGSPGVLPQSDTEAYLWARKSAEMGLAKAEYAVGYFTEVGIGTQKNAREALEWFRKAADHGDKRAKERLRMAATGGRPASPALPSPPPQTSDYGRKGKGKEIRTGNSNANAASRNGNVRSQSVEGLSTYNDKNYAPSITSQYNDNNHNNGTAPRPEYAKLRLDSQTSPAQPPARFNRNQNPASPASSAAYDDPYAKFYESPHETYGRPAPIERLTQQQFKEQQETLRKNSNLEQQQQQQQRRATDPTGMKEKRGVLQKRKEQGKGGEKEEGEGEGCIVC